MHRSIKPSNTAYLYVAVNDPWSNSANTFSANRISDRSPGCPCVILTSISRAPVALAWIPMVPRGPNIETEPRSRIESNRARIRCVALGAPLTPRERNIAR